jgi:hypothetical protein
MEQVRKLHDRADHYIRLAKGVGNLTDAAHLKSLADEANQAAAEREAAIRLAEPHTPAA